LFERLVNKAARANTLVIAARKRTLTLCPAIPPHRSDKILQTREFCGAIVVVDGEWRPAISASDAPPPSQTCAQYMLYNGTAALQRSLSFTKSFIRRSTYTVIAMGILDTVGEIAGAVAAVEVTEKVDPEAGLLTKGIAAIAGFKGAGALESLVEKKEDGADAQAPDADSDNAASQA
jgi:hypothetical protein